MKTITLRDANQGFARCVREVEAGEEFVITRNGAPVARLMPMTAPAAETGPRKLTPRQVEAFARIKARMEDGWPLGGERLDREALYDRALRREK